MSTILVVDDLPVFREPIAAALEHGGFEAIGAADGREALALLRERRVDLVLLDLAMPGMNGLEFLRTIRGTAAFKQIPVMLLTAITDRQAVLSAAKLGVKDYLLKSRFSLSELMARIRKHLEEAGVSGSGARAGVATAAVAVEGAGGSSVEAGVSGIEAEAASDVAAAMSGLSADASALEAIKSLKPILTRSQINERLEECNEIKAMSPTVGQVLKLTHSASCSLDQVGRVIKQDQAIALKVLKLANSVVYSRGEPVESVHKAVMRIGVSQIQQVVMNIAVIDSFSANLLPDRLNVQLFWEHSIATGLIAAEITRSLGGKENEVDTAFTMGLLHDVGKMVFAERFAEAYGPVLEAAEQLRLPLEQVEARMLLVNHADLMDKVLHQWKFSKQLINPIALHHLSMGNIRNLAPRMVQEVATLALANRLAHAMLLGSSGNLAVYDTEDFIRALKLGAEAVARIERVVPEQTTDLKFAMLNAGAQSDWPDVRGQLRDRIGSPMRPIYISEDPALDGYRMLSDALRTHSEEAGPNVAIAHIRNVSQRVMVTTRLKQAEAEAGVGKLPLIAISPKGNIVLEDSAMAGRRFEALASPTALLRFVDAARKLLGGGEG